MKTLTNPQIEISEDGKSGTLKFDIEDRPFNAQIITRVTHTHLNPDNMRHPRAIQSSNEAVFILSPREKVAIPNDFLISAIAKVAPNTSFAPHFKKSSKPGHVEVASELPVKLQWQVSDHKDFIEAKTPSTPPTPAVWSDLPDQTAASLDESLVKKGQWIRCVAVNSAGQTITQPAKKV